MSHLPTKLLFFGLVRYPFFRGRRKGATRCNHRLAGRPEVTSMQLGTVAGWIIPFGSRVAVLRLLGWSSASSPCGFGNERRSAGSPHTSFHSCFVGPSSWCTGPGSSVADASAMSECDSFRATHSKCAVRMLSSERR